MLTFGLPFTIEKTPGSKSVVRMRFYTHLHETGGTTGGHDASAPDLAGQVTKAPPAHAPPAPFG